MNQDVSEAQRQVQGALAQVKEFGRVPPESFEEGLATLAAYECWTQFFVALEKRASKQSDRAQQDLVRLANVCQKVLSETDRAGHYLEKLIRLTKPAFATFRVEALAQVIDPEDFASEARILEAVVESFPAEKERILCLERLCLLYEKKIHNDTKLQQAYERLLKTAPHNVKALRYFKLAYTQMGDWDQVAMILRDLLAHVPHKQELFRYAQELAAILLYQLDRPAETIAVLEEHCADSPLDTSTIHFDAYRRLGEPAGCIRVLNQCLLSVKSDRERSILHYKIAEIELQLGNRPHALDNFKKSVKLFPSLIEAHEQLIYLLIQINQWPQVVDALMGLAEHVTAINDKNQIVEASTRLKSALTNK